MKKRATPRIRIMLNRKLECFLRSPAQDEKALRNELLGKNTTQAVRIIAREFEGRFEGKGRSAEEIIKILLPKRRAVSWVALDIGICELCRVISLSADYYKKIRDGLEPGWEDMPDVFCKQAQFLNNVRYIIQSLPKRKDYVDFDGSCEYKDAEEMAKDFGTCHLCWRSVLRKPKQKKTPLCYEHHALKSIDSEYRRRNNMRKLMVEIRDDLEDNIPTPCQVRQTEKMRPDCFYIQQCYEVCGYFPSIAKYLSQRIQKEAHPSELIRAIEEPIPLEKISNIERDAWNYHFHDYGEYFELYFEKMILMEAWLLAENEYKHGGKRTLKKEEDSDENKSEFETSETRWWARYIHE